MDARRTRWWSALLVATWASTADAQQSKIVPGLMGPNALPAIPVEDAAIAPDVILEVAGASSFDGDAADRAFAPHFKLVVPFRDIAALEVHGTPLEVWRVSPATRARFGGAAESGVVKGDVGFGARFALLGERPRRPAVGLRLVTKSTAGKGLEDRRFTDAPAYAIEILAAKTVRERRNDLLRRLRVLTKLGLFSWAQEQGLQDDAIDYGIAVDGAIRGGSEVRLELRGYQGYQRRDKPMLASVRLLHPLRTGTAVALAVNRGIRPDAPAWELRAGLVVSWRTPFRER